MCHKLKFLTQKNIFDMEGFFVTEIGVRSWGRPNSRVTSRHFLDLSRIIFPFKGDNLNSMKTPPYSPDLPYFDSFTPDVLLKRRHTAQIAYPIELRKFLGDVVGKLGQGLG